VLTIPAHDSEAVIIARAATAMTLRRNIVKNFIFLDVQNYSANLPFFCQLPKIIEHCVYE
jgi:hypothetical protein